MIKTKKCCDHDCNGANKYQEGKDEIRQHRDSEYDNGIKRVSSQHQMYLEISLLSSAILCCHIITMMMLSTMVN